MSLGFFPIRTNPPLPESASASRPIGRWFVATHRADGTSGSYRRPAAGREQPGRGVRHRTPAGTGGRSLATPLGRLLWGDSSGSQREPLVPDRPIDRR